MIEPEGDMSVERASKIYRQKHTIAVRARDDMDGCEDVLIEWSGESFLSKTIQSEGTAERQVLIVAERQEISLRTISRRLQISKSLMTVVKRKAY